MASKAFEAAARAVKESKNLDSVIVGGPVLGAGTHEVTIQAVDTSDMDAGKLTVTYSGPEDRVYTDRMFTMSQDQTEFSFGLRGLWSAVLADKEAIGRLLELAAKDNHALELLTGMKLKITLYYSDGIQARATGTGKFAGFNSTTGKQETEEFPNIKEVGLFCKANGIPRSFLRLGRSEAIAKEENLAAFWPAAEAHEAAKPIKAVKSF